jgi:hypothetical protein
MISLNMTGIAQVTQQLQRLVSAPLPAVGATLYAEGNGIMAQSVQLVPIDTGLLRSTSHVARPVIAGATVTVELSYGSHGTAPYAAIIEFDVTLNHPHGGQAHYLSQPLFAATQGFTQRIAADLQGSLS